MASHNEVAHNWAHQTGRARKGFNMFYDGPTIYSYGYHFPIARIVTAEDGGRAILFTTADYSVSTSKHKSYVRRAIPLGERVFYVDHVANGSAYYRDDHAAMVRRMEQALEKAARARKYADLHLSDAERFATQANEFNYAFRLGLPIVGLPGNLDAIRERIAAARREEARRQAEREARDREAIDAWVHGTRDDCPHTRLPHVRVKGDTVETSWGIRVPLAEALPLFRLARKCARDHAEFTPRTPVMVGNWQLAQIDRNGAIRAGCHIIPLERQQLAAELAGVA